MQDKNQYPKLHSLFCIQWLQMSCSAGLSQMIYVQKNARWYHDSTGLAAHSCVHCHEVKQLCRLWFQSGVLTCWVAAGAAQGLAKTFSKNQCLRLMKSLLLHCHLLADRGSFSFKSRQKAIYRFEFLFYLKCITDRLW